jgi:hypothetical protein
MSITNDSRRLIQQGETAIRDNSNCSWERSRDRERRERAEAAMRKPVAQKHPWTLEAEREQAAKDAERARLIAEGKIVIDPITGIETHYLQGNRY